MLGLRTGSGLTVGVLGAVIGVEWSLALSASAVVLVALGLLAADLRSPSSQEAAAPGPQPALANTTPAREKADGVG
jgi:hypothetical protein